MSEYSQAIGQVGGLGTSIWGLVDASNIFGKKPQVAQYKNIPIGPGAATQADIAGFPGISQLGNLYQSYMGDQLNNVLPGFSDIMKSGSTTTQQMLSDAEPLLKGEIPQDVIDQIQRSDAYQSLSGGFAGSQMGHNLTARDLGLTSLDLMGKGATLAGEGGNAAQRWAGLAKGETLDPSSFLTTPQQAFQEQYLNQMGRLGTQQAKFNVTAAPNPASAGSFNLLNSYFGSMAGGGGSGGGGGSSGGGFDIGSLLSFI